MEKIGTEMSANEIAEMVSRDKAFYDNSGGGVTISGGEPTLQPEFLCATLEAVRTHGIHTALETCGYFDEALLNELPDITDLFLYDIKHLAAGIHKKFTGVSNERILSNFSQLLSRVGSERIVPRIPIIPQFNDDPDSADCIASFLMEAGYSGPIHLMPYNRMARTKWEKIGRGSSYRDLGVQEPEDVQRVISRFERASFEIICNQ
jgi:pyruvate formate lyase activating enzyme